MSITKCHVTDRYMTFKAVRLYGAMHWPTRALYSTAFNAFRLRVIFFQKSISSSDLIRKSVSIHRCSRLDPLLQIQSRNSGANAGQHNQPSSIAFTKPADMDRILNALYWDYRRDIGAGIAYPLEVPNSTFVPNMADNCHFILVITKCENSIPLLHMLSNFCANHKPSIICDPFIRDNVPNIRVTLNCVHSLVHVFVNYVHRLGHECLHLGSNHCTLCYSDSHTTAECTQCLICNPYESVCNDFRKCDKNKGVAFKKLPHQLSTNGTTRRQREKLIRDGNLTVHFSKIGSIYEYHYKEGEIVSHFVGMCVEKCIGLSGIGSPAVSVIITTKQKGKNIQTILYCIINNNKCMENSNTLFSGVSANESAKGISPVEAKHKVLKHCANKVVFTHNGAGDWHSLNITGQDLMKHNIRIIDLSKLPYFQCDQGENGSLFNSLADISAFLSLDDDNNVKRKIQIYDKVVRSCAYHSIEQNSRATCAAGLELIRRLRDHDKPLPTYRDVAQVGKRLKLHPKTADIVYKHLTDKDSECGDNAGIADQKYRNTDQTKSFGKYVNKICLPNGRSIMSNELLIELTKGKHSALNSITGANSGGLALNITFAGTVSISAAGSDGHAVKVSTAYLGGLGLLLGLNAEQNKAFSLDSESIPSDPFLKNIYETNLNSQKMLSTSETGVLVAHGSATGSQITTNNGKLESGLIGGFVVGSVTKVSAK
ncbi:unnamed protein product [Medioppia subpectinata]|uniref:Uncharacterized protein n=1 Tax=Medioppia subpectinata TaxID=1979941 RepID=A0A7R9KTU8_9ACAR|nr:unnamed protein product [Medioppia subpectinata]CAG2108558.1 unnamed protein product [Medioppia subpectinata]